MGLDRVWWKRWKQHQIHFRQKTFLLQELLLLVCDVIKVAIEFEWTFRSLGLKRTRRFTTAENFWKFTNSINCNCLQKCKQGWIRALHIETECLLLKRYVFIKKKESKAVYSNDEILQVWRTHLTHHLNDVHSKNYNVKF